MAKILAVDDDPIWLGLCQMHLENIGHRVLTALGYLEAIYMIQTDKPDLVILDLRMPISGRSLLQVIKRQEPDIPVIIHSVYRAYENDPDLAFKKAFVTKSTDPKELISAVNGVLDNS